SYACFTGRLLDEAEAGVAYRGQDGAAQEDVTEVAWERDVGIEDGAEREPCRERDATPQDVTDGPERAEFGVGDDLGSDVGERDAADAAGSSVDGDHHHHYQRYETRLQTAREQHDACHEEERGVADGRSDAVRA